MRILNERHLRELVYGGAVLGGGGGGSIECGLAAGQEALALGTPRIVRIEELPPRALVVTLSVVGPVTGLQAHLQHERALRYLSNFDHRSINAIIPSEVGPQAVTYGWRESVSTGIPIADAPCNGRAHPFGLMGSLGLHRHPLYVTSTVALGGNGDSRARVELVIRAPAAQASQMVRQAAAQSGLALSVARNPLPASYVKRHAAVGALSFAQDIGKIVVNELSRGLPFILERLQSWTGGRVFGTGRVISAILADRKGFTMGVIRILDRAGAQYRVPVCNEYLALERNGATIAIFPDLITLFDLERALPLSSAEVKAGARVAIFGIPRAHLKLGSTMKEYKQSNGYLTLKAAN